MEVGLFARSRSAPSPASRFWSRVDRRDPDDCWEWIAGKDGKGYGAIWVFGRNVQAHKLSLMIAVVDIPEGSFVCHTCDNRACVNPNHLYVGDHESNTLDRDSRMRQAYGERNAGAKLRESDVFDIKAKYASGHRQKDIAEEYGVSQTAISRVVTSKTWSHSGRAT